MEKPLAAALSLYNKTPKMEVGLCTVIWDDILRKVGKNSKTLQNSRLDVDTAALLDRYKLHRNETD